MAKSLRNKVVVITGASAGIGRECARLFAEEGAHVVVAARRQERLEALKSRNRSAGRQMPGHAVRSVRYLPL